MFKVIGILIIMGSMTLFGEKCVELMKTRVKSLESLIKLLDVMEAKISSFCMPINSIFEAYADAHLEKCGFSEALRKTNLYEAINNKSAELCLEESEIILLSKFSSELGQYTAAEQVKRCGYYRRELEKILSGAKEKLPVNTKLLRSSGVMCGILAAVLLI